MRVGSGFEPLNISFCSMEAKIKVQVRQHLEVGAVGKFLPPRPAPPQRLPSRAVPQQTEVTAERELPLSSKPFPHCPGLAGPAILILKHSG